MINGRGFWQDVVTVMAFLVTRHQGTTPVCLGFAAETLYEGGNGQR